MTRKVDGFSNIEAGLYEGSYHCVSHTETGSLHSIFRLKTRLVGGINK